MIDLVIGICQALFILGGAWWGYSYYSGRLQFSGEAEKRRQERVKRYGIILMLAVIACVIGGVILLVIKVAEFAKIAFT